MCEVKVDLSWSWRFELILLSLVGDHGIGVAPGMKNSGYKSRLFNKYYRMVFR